MDVLASDDDRERAVIALRDATVEGRLTLEEFSDRVGHAELARTSTELDAALAGLPAVGSADLPVSHSATFSRLQRSGRWSLAPSSTVRSVCGTIDLDLRLGDVGRPRHCAERQELVRDDHDHRPARDRGQRRRRRRRSAPARSNCPTQGRCPTRRGCAFIRRAPAARCASVAPERLWANKDLGHPPCCCVRWAASDSASAERCRATVAASARKFATAPHTVSPGSRGGASRKCPARKLPAPAPVRGLRPAIRTGRTPFGRVLRQDPHPLKRPVSGLLAVPRPEPATRRSSRAPRPGPRTAPRSSPPTERGRCG